MMTRSPDELVPTTWKQDAFAFDVETIGIDRIEPLRATVCGSHWPPTVART
jgi:hypothetical protein